MQKGPIGPAVGHAPVITAHEKEDSDDESEDIVIPPSQVALVCRIELEPYVWCGSLEYVSHDPHSRPISFTWRLKDFDKLRTIPEFQRLLHYAAHGVAGSSSKV